MSKPVKNLVTQEYKRSYGEVDSACVVSVIGLDAIATNRLRGELRAKKIRVQVIKNSLAKRAFADTRLGPLAGALDGPCALVTGGESIIDVAKVLVESKRKYPQLELKFGILGGEPELIDVVRMAAMKSRHELLADVAMLLASPGRKLAACLVGPAARVAGCIKAITEKKGPEGPAAEAVPA